MGVIDSVFFKFFFKVTFYVCFGNWIIFFFLLVSTMIGFAIGAQSLWVTGSLDREDESMTKVLLNLLCYRIKNFNRRLYCVCCSY